MGNDIPEREEPAPLNAKLTGPMRWLIASVAVVAIVGLCWAAWISSMGSADPAASGSTPTDAPASPQAGPSPGATPAGGSEVPPPTQEDPAQHSVAAPGPSPRVALPLPANAHGGDALVEGFPTDLAGPMSDATVIDNSVASDGSTLQVTLTARTTESPEIAAKHYRDLWVSLGLVPSGDAATGFSAADPYTRLDFAADASGTGTVYTIFAILRTV